jgi:hypothetical protein
MTPSLPSTLLSSLTARTVRHGLSHLHRQARLDPRDVEADPRTRAAVRLHTRRRAGRTRRAVDDEQLLVRDAGEF